MRPQASANTCPLTFAADFTTETLRRKIPFDIVKRQVDDKAYANFRQIFPPEFVPNLRHNQKGYWLTGN